MSKVAVKVKWADRKGNTKTTQMYSNELPDFRGRIESKGGTVVSVKKHTASGGSGRTYYKRKRPVPTTPAQHKIEEKVETIQQLPARLKARKEYKKTGHVPEDIRGQIETPDLVKEAGLSEEYKRSVYEESIGYKTERPKGFVGPVAPSGMTRFKTLFQQKTYGSKEWVQRHGVFITDKGEKKTWRELKEEHPALYLEKQDGSYTPKFDVRRWTREYYKDVDPVLGGVHKFSFSVGQAFDVGMWSRLVTEGKKSAQDYALTKQYGMVQDIKKGKSLETWAKFQIPAYQNVIIPFAIGGGAGYLFRGAGALSSTLGGTGGKILGHVSTKGPKIVGGVAVGYAGYDVGSTAFSKGPTSQPTVEKLMRYGSQFGFAYAGAKAVSSYKPTIGVSRGSRGEIVFQKHLTSFRGKPVLKYGKPVVFGETAQGYSKIVSPFSSRGLRFSTPKSFLKSTQGFGSTIKSSQIVPYQPSGLAEYYAPVFGMHPPVGQPSVYSSQWGNKLYAETGSGWRSGIDKRGFSLSTEVYPKPKLYRSYEWYYRFIVFEKSPIGIRSKPVWLKDTGRSFKAKDVFKSDKQLSKDFGSGSIQKDGTVTLQKAKTISQQKQITKQITKQLYQQEKLVVPESLLKPVYQRKQYQMLGSSQAQKMLSGLESRQALKPRNMMGVVFDSAYSQDMDIGFKRAKKSKKKYDTSLFGLFSGSFSSSALRSFRMSRKKQDFGFVIPFFGGNYSKDSFFNVEDSFPSPLPPPPPPVKKTPYYWPDDTGSNIKRFKLDDFIARAKGYRFRTWKVPTHHNFLEV